MKAKQRMGRGGVRTTQETANTKRRLSYPQGESQLVPNLHGATVIAGSSPALSPTYRSKWEAQYAVKLDLEVKAGIITAWRYEAMSFTLSKGKRYRPDFLIQHPYGMERRLEFVEVKGRWGKNRRDGMTHLKWCAQLYPMFTWTLAMRDGQGWEHRPVIV